jgi:hypothetical protein
MPSSAVRNDQDGTPSLLATGVESAQAVVWLNFFTHSTAVALFSCRKRHQRARRALDKPVWQGDREDASRFVRENRSATTLIYKMKFLGNLKAHLHWAVVLLAACGGGSSADTSPPPPPPTVVSFSAQISPILSKSCTYCHHPGSATAVDLTHPYDSAMGIIRRPNSWTEAQAKVLVDPGNPSNSFLIQKVSRDDLDPHIEGSRMPWAPPRVTPDEAAAIRQWITDGANDDEFYQQNVAVVFGDGMSLGSRGGKCSYCHYANTYQLPDLTHPFDPNVGVINKTSSKGSKIVVPGDPDSSLLVQKIEATEPSGIGNPMPMAFPLLAQHDIDLLTSWVAEGAPDN